MTDFAAKVPPKQIPYAAIIGMAASLFASAGLSSVVDPFLVQLDALSPHAVPVLKFFLLFTLVYKLGKSTAPARLSVADTGYWGSSVTSTVHGFIVTYLGWVGCRDAQLFTTTDLYKTTPSTELACQCFLGYILQDTFTLFTYLKEWKGSTPYVFHHISAAYAWGLCLRFGVAQLMTCPLLLCEATALFTNARWVFSILGGAWRNGPIYLVNGLLMYVSFFALRVCMMGWLGYHFLYELRAESSRLPSLIFYSVSINWALGWALQLFWFKAMTLGMIKVLFPKPKEKKKEEEKKA